SDPVLAAAELPAPLASPWLRLVAVFLDGLTVQAIVIPVRWFAGAYETTSQGDNYHGFFMRTTPLWSLIGLGVWLLLNWTFLQNGQTIGKRLLKLQVQRKDGSRIPAVRNLTHRVLPITLLEIVPVVGGLIALVDALLIFREKHNTLHDDIADTKVVQLPG
ncbi:MAG: RDD family protein, partial [Prosthecobacter sp.]|nr:RDD family protein [Prosthecobacter sp.]